MKIGQNIGFGAKLTLHNVMPLRERNNPNADTVPVAIGTDGKFQTLINDIKDAAGRKVYQAETEDGMILLTPKPISKTQKTEIFGRLTELGIKYEYNSRSRKISLSEVNSQDGERRIREADLTGRGLYSSDPEIALKSRLKHEQEVRKREASWTQKGIYYQA